MPESLAELIRTTITSELPHLRGLPADLAAIKPRENGWSPKQELGHLIDSAVNNHQRFVRATLHGDYSGPGYVQNAWVDLHDYQNMPFDNLVEIWYQFNNFLAHLVEQIPDSARKTPCTIGNGSPLPLDFVIQDYVVHMQHHLDHLLGRAEITPYPQVPTLS
jgi:hypothetical protein